MRTRLHISLVAAALLLGACVSLPPPQQGVITDRRAGSESIFAEPDYFLKIDDTWFRVNGKIYKSCGIGDAWTGRGCAP